MIDIYLDDYDDIVRCGINVKLPRTMIVIDDMEIAIPLIPDDRITRFINTVKSNRTATPAHDHNGVSGGTEGEYPATLFSSSIHNDDYFGYTSNHVQIRVCEGECYLEIQQYFNHNKTHTVFSMTKKLPNDKVIKALELYLKEKPLFTKYK